MSLESEELLDLPACQDERMLKDLFKKLVQQFHAICCNFFARLEQIVEARHL